MIGQILHDHGTPFSVARFARFIEVKGHQILVREVCGCLCALRNLGPLANVAIGLFRDICDMLRFLEPLLGEGTG